MVDNCGREINYLRVSVTDLCNLRCLYCMPEKGVEKLEHSEILSFEEIVKVIKACTDLGINKIRFTGGEPLIRKDIVKLVEYTKQLNKVKKIAMTTNGILLSKFVKPLKEAGLDNINISLDTFDKDKFFKITRGGNLNEVVKGIDKALELGMNVKINCVAMKGFNDDEISTFVDFAKDNPAYIRFIELMPIGNSDKNLPYEFISIAEIMEKIEGLHESFESKSVAKYYKLDGFKGKIGFISPISNHFCHECNKIRLTSDGKLKPCLHTNDEIDLKPFLLDEVALKDKIADCIVGKPEKHMLNDGEIQDLREMNCIGG